MFAINPIKPSMSHEQKVYEYARRISHYSLAASSERSLSKSFNCQNLDRNLEIFGEICGCNKNGADVVHGSCEPCNESSKHYIRFREAKSKQGAAMRQLNKEMAKGV